MKVIMRDCSVYIVLLDALLLSPCMLCKIYYGLGMVHIN